jgi:glycosyltransferase involved in cell wall biosynthesis
MDRAYRLAVLQSHPIQYFAPLFRRLAQEPKIDLTVYYCSRMGLEEYADVGFGQRLSWDTPLLEGYHAVFLPNLRRTKQAGGFLSLINVAFVRELKKNQYDALWVHGHRYATYLLGILAANLFRISVLMRCETHLLLSRSTVKRALRGPMMRLFYTQLCDRCLPIGTRNREFYLAHGVRSEHLFDVPYTVDNTYFTQSTAKYAEQRDAIRIELGLPTDRPIILFASKFSQRKRPMDLLQAYEQLRHKEIDAALVMIGSGELEAALREYAATRPVPDVHFMGFRNQSELPRFYAISDIFVLPSEDEPWGLVINEAMCGGLPIVASEEIGAVSDLVRPETNGLTFKSGDVSQLTAHLQRLVTDEALRRRMGIQSLALIREWNLDRCTQGVLAALDSLLI